MGCAQTQVISAKNFVKLILSCLRFINTLHSKMAAACSSKNTSSCVLLVPTVCKRSYTVHMLWRQYDRQNLKGQHREKGFEIFFIKWRRQHFFFYRITKFDGTFLIIHFRLLFFFKNSLLAYRSIEYK